MYIKSTLTCRHKQFYVGVCVCMCECVVVACTIDVVGHSQTSLYRLIDRRRGGLAGKVKSSRNLR